MLQHNRSEVCMWAAFGGLVRKVLQSQVFVSISAGINRLSRKRSRPSAITGPEAESSTCSSVFTKWPNCSFIFLKKKKKILEAESTVWTKRTLKKSYQGLKSIILKILFFVLFNFIF